MDDSISLWVTAPALGLGLLIAGHFYYKNLYDYWRKKGVPGPKPIPILGNMLAILTSNRLELERSWAHKYGKFYGVYQGGQPRLVIADAEVLRQICIKDFDIFPNHGSNEFLNKYQKEFLFFMRDDHWRKVRALMSPTFTSGKMKRMYKLLNICADDLDDCFEEQLPTDSEQHRRDGTQVNLKDIFSLYTMDGIASCCYGLKLERKGSADMKTAASRNQFVAIGLKLFEFNLFRVLLAFSIPHFILRFFGYKLSPERAVEPLAKRVQQLIDSRRSTDRKFDDYLQLLLDAKLNDELELGEMDNKENHHAGLTTESLLADQKHMIQKLNKEQNGEQTATTGNKVELTDHEILSSAMFLLIVGLETTASLLTSCGYALAFHEDIQRRLYEEIKSIAKFDEKTRRHTFEYDQLTSLPYLDSVISETLRLLSPVIQLDREASTEYTIEKYNVTIPKDSKILLAFHAIMNDPEYWEKPEVFDPERFMPENRDKIVPGSYCPFGIGPRHCIGMRFSLTEAKLALAKVLMKYRFYPAPTTKFPPEPKMNLGLNALKSPLVMLVPRTE